MPLVKTYAVLCFDITLLGTDMQTWIVLFISFIVSSEMGISDFLCIYFRFC